MSLLYECINTVIAVLISISSGLPDHNSSIQLCVQKLRILIEDTDQNLKYLGLLAMSRILKTHPKSVQSHKDLVLTCLEDKDESIRLRALDLIIGMISKKNLIEIIHKLMQNVKNSNLGNKYRDELIFKIIEICSQNDYAFISNFEWYISVLVDLSQVEGGTVHANLIARQLFDVTIRVESITEFSTNQMSIMIENADVFTDFCDVLYAAAFICGEFAHYLTDKRKVCLNLLSKNYDFPAYIQATFLQNSLKIFVKLIENEKVDNLDELCDELNQLLKPFLFSDDFEVQERAATFQQILTFVRDKSIYNYENINLVTDNHLQNEHHQNNQKEEKESKDVDEITDDQSLHNNNDENLEPNDSSSDKLANLQEDINLEESLVKDTGIIDTNQSNLTECFRLEPILYGYLIKPVAEKAQKKVPIPNELDLDLPFRELQYSSDEEIKRQFNSEDGDELFLRNDSEDEEIVGVEKKKKKRKKHKKDKKASRKNKLDEIEEINDNEVDNLMYLQPKSKKTANKKVKDRNMLDVEDVAIVEEAVEASEGLVETNKMSIPGLVSSDKYFQENKKLKSNDKKSKKSKFKIV